MTKYIIIGSILLSIVGTGASFIYDKISSLKSDLLDLKATNKALIAKNSSLKKKQTDIKKKIKDRRKDLISKKLNRAKLKLAKAPATMVPIAGAAVVVGFTAYEIRNLCEDIKEYKEFEKSLFASVDNTISEDEKLLCGLNVEDELLSELNKYTETFQ